MGSQCVNKHSLLRLKISLRRTFSKPILAKMMKQYDESAAVLGLFIMFTVERCSETGRVRHLTSHAFRSL